MSPIRRARCSCRSGATSVSESHNSFGCTFETKGGTVNSNKVALLLLLGCTLAPISQAQIKHIEMRVEGMT
jgi:hypothetical protein